MKLPPEAEPRSFASKIIYNKEIEENGKFWGIPEKYITVTNNGLVLDSKITSNVDWNIDEVTNRQANINMKAQTIEVDGKKVDIEPGAFCSYIDLEHISENEIKLRD